MSDLRFRGNRWPTLGVEIELQLVDARTMALRSAIDEVRLGVPEALRDSVKPEFMQCYVEINTSVCRTVDDVEADLALRVRAVERAADRLGVGLVWAGTHPFSRWRDQRITPDERYYRLADLLQETVVRPVTFGLHVHVGVESGDRAIAVANRMQAELPILLAMSANSPFWQGRATGHHAHRIEVLEGFPTGGMMPPMSSWAEFADLLDRMKTAGFVDSHRELWWDVRPSIENGTLEVRICDMPADLADLLGLTAIIQCLVRATSDDIENETETETATAAAAGIATRIATDADIGSTTPVPHPLLLRQNRWRACRFGLDAELVDPITLEARPARVAARELIDRLMPVADGLGCRRALAHAAAMTTRPSGSEVQLQLYRELGDLAEVLRRMSGRSRLSAEPTPAQARPAPAVLPFPARVGTWQPSAIRPPLPPEILVP